LEIAVPIASAAWAAILTINIIDYKFTTGQTKGKHRTAAIYPLFHYPPIQASGQGGGDGLSGGACAGESEERRESEANKMVWICGVHICSFLHRRWRA
jgi:hypothetical protein